MKRKPEYIAIENLSISNMISKCNPNHVTKMSKYIQDSKFYYFFIHLINKCKYHSIPIHQAIKYFASSKKCSCCGIKKKTLELSDRIYICDNCGVKLDRDLNAAVNLVNMKKKDYILV